MRRILTITLLLLAVLSPLMAESGIACWYTSDTSGSLTANGEPFDPATLSAAHRSLIFGTIVKVTNLENGKNVNVRINDRGPEITSRIIALTPSAAKELDMLESGTANVSIETVSTPEKEETKYVAGKESGWFRFLLDRQETPSDAYTQYERLSRSGLHPVAELRDDGAIDLSVRWVGSYQAEKTVKLLKSLGYQTIEKLPEENPYL